MLHLFIGTDRAKARTALNAAVAKHAKGAARMLVSDAHTIDDLRAALQGGGMFAQARAVILDSVLGNEEMRNYLLASLPSIAASAEHVFLLEEKPDAATKKLLEKHAEVSEKFDAAKKEEGGSIFAIGNAMRRGDKKAAWVALQRELIAGKAPEAIHGMLFWAAKDMALKARAASEAARARALVAQLAELPHVARRQGFDLDCALEHFLLSRT
jgi:DNA polymerase III delta subunit